MQVFIGGLGGAGKKPISEILQSIGFSPGRPGMINADYDSPVMTACYKKVLSGEEGDKCLEVAIGRTVGEHIHFALKTGVSMFASAHLCRLFPESKFVLVVRDPVNHVCIDRNYDVETNRFLGFEDDSYRLMPIESRAEFWSRAYYIALNSLPWHYHHRLLIVKLEDLCDDAEVTSHRLLDFVESAEDVGPALESIRRQSDYNMGYETFKDGDIQTINSVTKDVRTEFGYNGD